MDVPLNAKCFMAWVGTWVQDKLISTDSALYIIGQALELMNPCRMTINSLIQGNRYRRLNVCKTMTEEIQWLIQETVHLTLELKN